MSVEKLSSNSRVKHEQIPFTQICNNVIYKIKDSDSFLVWCYLQSKTADWKVIKQDIKNNYGFGDKKLKKIFSYLHRANLLKYVQMHSASGAFARVDIRVLSGTNFDVNQEFNVCAHAGAEKGRAVKGTNLNDELLNKDITKQIKQPNTKPLSASVDAPAPDGVSFDDFWKIYPVKKNKVRSKNIWDKKKYNQIATLICEDVVKRINEEAQWKNHEFIPHPSTYLNNQRWTDDITYRVSKTSSSGSAFSDWLNNSDDSGVLKSNGVTHDGECFRV